ncbi:MAG: 23S rRNA (guanosine(2251)-2'-O)-methyltransferase RlmB [Candidatus Obscuribacterales bacterium]
MSNRRPGPKRSEDEKESLDRESLIFGRNTVLAYLEGLLAEEEGQPESAGVSKIFLHEGPGSDQRLTRIKKLAKDLRIPLVLVDRRKVDMLAGAGKSHQGIVASLSPVKVLSQTELLELVDRDLERIRETGGSADGYTVLVLDGIEDPRNLGAIIRCGEVMGAKAVVVPERRAAGINETVAKTSAGAAFHIPIARVTNLVRIIEALKERGLWAVGMTPAARDSIYRIDLKRPVILVVGSEGKGMGRLVEEKCDLLASIPVIGKTQSLNASVAAGIGLYEIVRQNSD